MAYCTVVVGSCTRRHCRYQELPWSLATDPAGAARGAELAEEVETRTGLTALSSSEAVPSSSPLLSSCPVALAT